MAYNEDLPRWYNVGVYCQGKPVFIFNKTFAPYSQVAIVVTLLDQVKDVLEPGHYFACEEIVNPKEG